jgi:hypothetical protein
MAKNFKSSSGHTHPYMRGYRFWKDNQFWNDGSVTKKGVEYFNQSLEEMRMGERQLTRLTAGK